MKAETLSIAGGMSEHETKQGRRPVIKRKARERDEAKSKTRTAVTSDWTNACNACRHNLKDKTCSSRGSKTYHENIQHSCTIDEAQPSAKDNLARPLSAQYCAQTELHTAKQSAYFLHAGVDNRRASMQLRPPREVLRFFLHDQAAKACIKRLSAA